MKRSALWFTVLSGAAVAITVSLGALVLIPRLLAPPLSRSDLRDVTSAERRIELRQAQSQVQNDARTTVLQLLGGLIVLGGAAAAWWQIHVTHEGQITDRFTRAVDQLGSNNTYVRLGGIYALERIAKNSPTDRRTVQVILGAFVRGQAPWSVGSPEGPQHPTPEVDDRRQWLRTEAPDVQTAVSVLARRPVGPDSPRLYLSRVDLRSLRLERGQLTDTNFRHANLARAALQGIRLDRSDLTDADLRWANLKDVSLTGASLRSTYLQHANLQRADLNGADLHSADLRHADLRGADLRAKNLASAALNGALADETTIWPPEFDAERRRSLRIQEAVIVTNRAPGGTHETSNGQALRAPDDHSYDATNATLDDQAD